LDRESILTFEREHDLVVIGSGPAGEGAIVSPSAKGIILIRRLAPSAERYAAAAAAGKADRCRLVWKDRIAAPAQE
jgi:succinate dehydrogenase/fumarate reductase flavoprotein subunit